MYGPLPTILFVEDDTAVLASVSRLLREEGFPVFRATNGHEALRILSDCQIDVLFADIVLPGMDGVELARWAKAMQPGIKILFATGYPQVASERAARHHARVLLKPVRHTEIIHEIVFAAH